MANGNGQANGNGHVAIAETLPPQNIEGEQSVLGSILHNPAGLAMVVDFLVPGDFWRDAHQVIYQAMLDLDMDGKPIMLDSLIRLLERQDELVNVGGEEYLEDIVTKVAHGANILYYAELVKEKKAARDLEEVSRENISDIRSNRFTADELVARASKRFGIIESVSSVEPDDEFNLNPTPERMRGEAFPGFLGEIVSKIAAETEACPEAILGQFLIAYGNLIGRGPYWIVDDKCHRANLFLCLTGPTGSGRKGSGWSVTKWLLRQCDPQWLEKPPLSGLTSGEGLIKYVQDNQGTGFALETEFGRLMANANREGNTLTHVMRQAFDGDDLSVPTRKDGLFVPGPHFSFIGHVTYNEFRARKTEGDIENGFINRFIFMHTYRVGELPEGGNLDGARQAVAGYVRRIVDSIAFARSNEMLSHEYRHDGPAREMWAPIYSELTRTLPGLYGSAVQRRAPIVRRLAMIYAVLDQKRCIQIPHIQSALAFWDYCDQTALHIFGDAKQDKKLAKLMGLLNDAPAGLTKTQINRKLGGGHLSPIEVDRLS